MMNFNTNGNDLNSSLNSAQYTCSSKKNPCPVCGRTKDGDCRSGELGNVVLCHTFKDATNEVKNGYRFVKSSDKGAGWGVWGWGEKKGKKSDRPTIESITTYDYSARDGSPLVRVHRQKGKQPEFWQSYWVGDEWVTASKVDSDLKIEMRSQVPLYRYTEVRKAIEQGKAILFVEGEVCANALWRIGIPATTTIAGSNSYSTWGDYSKDLQGARVVVGMPDRDQVGMKYLEAVMKDQPVAGWIKAFPNSPLWDVTLPNDGGLDVADWIKDGATKTDILSLIQAIEPSVETPLHLGTAHPKPFGSDVSATVASVEALLDRNLNDWQEENDLARLGQESGMDRKGFSALVASSRSRRDICETLEKFTANINPTIDLGSVLPSGLAAMMQHDGRMLGIDPIMLLQYLIGVMPAFLKKDSRLDIKGVIMPCVNWQAIVAKSGRGKSRAEAVICSHLTERQKSALKSYHEAKKEFDKFSKQAEKSKVDQSDELVPPATPRKYTFSVATIQGVIKNLKDQTDYGSTWIRDELAGLFKSLGQFSKGDHEGGEILLSLWDCRDVVWDRADADNSFIAESPHMAIIGGIQPGKYKQVFKDPDDVDGLAARILFSLPREINSKHNPGYCKLSDYLPNFFTLVENLNLGTVGIDRDAYLLWRDKEHEARMQGKVCGNGALDAWLHKASGHIGRLAFNLHAIECVEDPLKSRDTLTLETMQKAILLWEYFKACYEQIINTGSNSSDVQGLLTKILDKSIELNGLSAREANQYISGIAKGAKEANRTATAYAYDLFSQLVEKGKGQVKQIGKTRKFIPSILNSENITTLTTVDESLDIPDELPAARKRSVVSTVGVETKESPFGDPTPPEPKEDFSIHFADENIEFLVGYVQLAIDDETPEIIDSLFESIPLKIRDQIKELVMSLVSHPKSPQTEPTPEPIQESIDLNNPARPFAENTQTTSDSPWH